MNNTSYRLLKFGEYSQEGLWRSSEDFDSYNDVYGEFNNVVGELSSDPNLTGVAVLRVDDEKDFWYIEDSVGLGGLYLYKENGSLHIKKR